MEALAEAQSGGLPTAEGTEAQDHSKPRAESLVLTLTPPLSSSHMLPFNEHVR